MPAQVQTNIPMQVIAGCLVASIQVDLTTELLRNFQQELLERIRTSGVTGVILDVTGVRLMDVEDFDVLRRTMAMAAIMGTRPMLVGLRPGIVASLIELDADVEGIEAAADLDDALSRLGTSETESTISASGKMENAAAVASDEQHHEGTPDSHRNCL